MNTPSTLPIPSRTRTWYRHLDPEQRRVIAWLLGLLVVLLIANAIMWTWALSLMDQSERPVQDPAVPAVITDTVQL